MALCAVVADDLTGANTTGVLLTKAGFKILTMISNAEIGANHYDDYDGVVVNVASRGASSGEARLLVERATQELLQSGARYFSKRIDSTIRGNLGAEIEGMLSLMEEETVALVVPAYPASGKICIGGCLLLNAVPIERTAAGKDPIKPVKSAYLPDVIAEQTRLPVGTIPYAVVARGEPAIISSMKEQVEQGKKIIVLDTASAVDLEIVAKAVFKSGIKNITVDPGPYTQALFPLYKGISQYKTAKGKIFIVAGSVSEATRTQLELLHMERHAGFVNVDVIPFLDAVVTDEEARSIAAALGKVSEEHDLFGMRVGESPEMVLDLYQEAKKRNATVDDVSSRITFSLGKIARYTLDTMPLWPKGIYLTGGDMTVAFCKALGAHAIELEDEIIPHVSYGSLKGGKYSGLKITTKGGLIGKSDTAWECIKYMLGK